MYDFIFNCFKIILILILSRIFNLCQTLSSNHTLDDSGVVQQTNRVAIEKMGILFGDEPRACGKQMNITEAFFTQVGAERSALYGEFPWFAALELPSPSGQNSRYFYKCAGSIIGNRWLLTAAHCFNQTDLPTAVLGTINLKRQQEADILKFNHYRVSISSIYIHPDWDPVTMKNDIALLKTKEPIDLTGRRLPVSTVCLPESSEEPNSALNAIFTGFGAYAESLQLQPMKDLKVAETQVLPYDQCKVVTQGKIMFQGTMLCAGNSEIQKGPCNYDSGGSLVQFKNGSGTLIGITSWIMGDCGVYSGYTKVSSFIDWIFDTIESNQW